MISKPLISLLCLVIACLFPRPVVSHGRLWEPPGRSTMWRRGFNTPKNVNDNELYCGGFQHQLNLGYKCGVCGDAYDHAEPKPNEAGGRYATGTIARTYKQGQKATFIAQITANHLGWFTFKICPTNDHTIKATKECLDLHPVPLADGSGYRYSPGRQKGNVTVPVILPENLTCDFCVLQWRYHTGNSWGKGPDGQHCTGCGPQEEFYGCSDIRILPKSTQHTTNLPPEPTTAMPTPKKSTTLITTTQNPTSPQTTTQKPITRQTTIKQPTTQQTTIQQSTSQKTTIKQSIIPQSSTPQPTTNQPTTELPTTQQPISPQPTTPHPTNPKPTTQQPVTPHQNTLQTTAHTVQPTAEPTTQTSKPQTSTPHKVCHGVHGNHAFDNWCKQNCKVGNCPSNICVCGVLTPQDLHSNHCHPIGVYANMQQYSNWCNANCRRGYCPHNICRCD